MPEVDTVADESVIAKIDGAPVTFENVLDRLRIQKKWSVIDDCLSDIVVERVWDKTGISIATEAVRDFMMNFRKQNKLLSGVDTKGWLDAHKMSDNDFVEMCQFELKKDALIDKMFSATLEQYYQYKRLNLVSADLYLIELNDEEMAKEIAMLVRDGASFFDLAHKYSINASTRKSCGYMGRVELHTLDAKVQELITTASDGCIIGPVAILKCFHIYFIDTIHQPVFDDDTKKKLGDELLASWVREFKSRPLYQLEI